MIEPFRMEPSPTRGFTAAASMDCSVSMPSESTIRKREAAELLLASRTSTTCSTGCSVPMPSACSAIAATAPGVSCGTAAAPPSFSGSQPSRSDWIWAWDGFSGKFGGLPSGYLRNPNLGPAYTQTSKSDPIWPAGLLGFDLQLFLNFILSALFVIRTHSSSSHIFLE